MEDILTNIEEMTRQTRINHKLVSRRLIESVGALANLKEEFMCGEAYNALSTASRQVMEVEEKLADIDMLINVVIQENTQDAKDVSLDTFGISFQEEPHRQPFKSPQLKAYDLKINNSLFKFNVPVKEVEKAGFTPFLPQNKRRSNTIDTYNTDVLDSNHEHSSTQNASIHNNVDPTQGYGQKQLKSKEPWRLACNIDSRGAKPSKSDFIRGSKNRRAVLNRQPQRSTENMVKRKIRQYIVSYYRFFRRRCSIDDIMKELKRINTDENINLMSEWVEELLDEDKELRDMSNITFPVVLKRVNRIIK